MEVESTSTRSVSALMAWTAFAALEAWKIQAAAYVVASWAATWNERIAQSFVWDVAFQTLLFSDSIVRS